VSTETNLQIVEQNPAAPVIVSEAAAIISMIERAARDPAVDVEKFERLMALKERAEAMAAKKAFNAAIAAAKGEIGPILKNKVVDFTSQKGRTNYRHEDFAEVARTVDPVLNKYGLSYRFKTTQAGGKLVVTCIVSHADGFSEETTLESGEDHSGNKNSIQAIGSAATYLQRYTLKLALGLAASDKDDDGAGPSRVDVVSDDQREALQNRIIEVGADPQKFLQFCGVERVGDLPARDFQKAMSALDAKARKDA
jgi:hypothetical protein